MFRVAVSIFIFLLTANSRAAPVTVRQSQQFKVIDARPVSASSPGPLKSKTGEYLLKLDADVLLVSAERIRECLRTQLGLPRDGGGEIQLVLLMASTPNDLIRFAAARSPGGWEYELQIPDQLEREKLVRAVSGVILLELANRGQGPKSAEIPSWLVEGLALHLSAVAGPDLVVGAVPIGGMLPIVRVWRGTDYRLDYLQAARAILRSSPPLTFAELSHPKPETLAADRLKVFQFSSQLFVYELLHLKEGPANLVKMLRALPGCWNWETAFLQSFSGPFRNLLEIEKWWSVNLLAFTARDPSQIWSKVTCLDQLDELLSVSAEIRITADTLPQRRNLTLQQVITNWPYAEQVPVVQQKLMRLVSLRFNAAPEVIPIIEGYERSLSLYLQRRNQVSRGAPENRMQPAYDARFLAKDTIGELEQLDKRRQALRPEQALSVNSTISR